MPLLNLFGEPDLSAYGGLLDPASLQKIQKGMADRERWAMSAALLEAGGPSLQPINFGQALARGIQARQGAGDAYMGQHLPMAVQARQFQLKQQQEAEQRAREQQLRGGMSAYLQAKLAGQDGQAELASIGDVSPETAIGLMPKPTVADPFTLSEGQVRFGPDGKPIAALPKAAPSADPEAAARAEKERFDQAAKLRGEFQGLQTVKDFQVVRDGYARVASAATEPSAAGDLSLVFGYMKMLDPTSSVREGEYANAQNAAGVPEQIRNLLNQVRTGQRLAPEQRADFLAQAQKLYSSQLAQVQTVGGQYKGLADKYQLPADRVVLDYAIPQTDLERYQDQIQRGGGLVSAGTDPKTGLPLYRVSK